MSYTIEQKLIDSTVKEQLADLDSYPKSLHNQLRVCYAYEYFLVNLKDQGFCLLKMVPRSYFKDQIKREFSSDRSYKSLVKRLVKKIDKDSQEFKIISDSVA